MGRLLALFGCLSILALADDSYPEAPGTAWTYEHETRAVDPVHPRLNRWVTLEINRGSRPMPEGTVLDRDVQIVQGHPDGSWIASRGEFGYLIRQSCVYFLDRQYAGPGTLNLSPGFRESLLGGEVSPDLCFPLEVGKTWQASHTAEWSWTVVGHGCGDAASCPDSVSSGDFHLVAAQAASGGTAHTWFRPGVGITGFWYWHAGTYGELRVRLLKFEPAAR